CEAAFAAVVARMAAGRLARLERVRLPRVLVAFLHEYDLLLTPCVPIAPCTAGDNINIPDAMLYPDHKGRNLMVFLHSSASIVDQISISLKASNEPSPTGKRRGARSRPRRGPVRVHCP